MRKKEVLIVLFMVIGIILSFSLINLTKIQTITTSIVYSTPEKITISLLDEENNIISQIAPETEERTNVSFEHQGNNIEFISLEPKTLNIKFFTKSDKDFIKTNIVAISWNPDFEKARVTLKKITNEKISVIYKCKTFDFNKGKCKSEWMPTNIEFEQTADKITFEVSSFSAYAGGSSVTEGGFGVAQVNNAPVLREVNVTPDPVYFVDDLKCWANATDADGDNITYFGIWYKDGVEQYNIWNKSYNFSDTDESNDIYIDSDGYIYITGAITSEKGDANLLILKLNSSGNALWNKTYDLGGDDSGLGIVTDSSGTILIAGRIFKELDSDLFVAKLDSSGSMFWNKTFGGSGDEEGYGVVIDSTNNIYVTGVTSSYGAGSSDVWILKLDSNGNLIWNKTFGGSNDDGGYGIALLSDNNLTISGDTNSFGAGAGDAWIIKIDQNGNHIWNTTFGTAAGVEKARAIKEDSNGNLIFAGSTNASGNYDFLVVKLSSTGTHTWNKTIDFGSEEESYDLDINSNDDVILIGDNSLAPPSDIFFVKLNSSGEQVWNKSFDSGNDDAGSGIDVSVKDEFVLLGASIDTFSGFQDIEVIKYYGFSLNNQPQGQKVLLDTISSADTQVGEQWYCKVQAYDEEDLSGYNSSNVVTIKGGTIITDCGSLDTPSESYLLMNDANVSGTTCFSINANNITLYCVGHTVTGDGSGFGAVASNVNSVTVRNCTFKNLDVGVYFSAVSDGIVKDNFLNGSEYGIYLSSTSNSKVTDNMVNSNSVGIFIYNSSGNTFTDNTVNNNQKYGIDLYYSWENTFTDNTVAENGELDLAGMVASNTHCNNLIVNMIGSGNLPILLYNSSSVIQNNIVSELILCNADNSNVRNITIKGSSLKRNNALLVTLTEGTNFTEVNSSDNYYGVLLLYSSNNLFANNTMNNNQYGFYANFSSGNTIENTNLLNNLNYGVRLMNASDNVIKNSVLSNAIDIIIKENSTSNKFSNVQVSSYPTNISLIYDPGSFSGSIEIDGIDSPPSPDPSGWHNISKYINITNNNGPAWLWLNISYSDSDISGIDESSLKIWKYNGTTWLESGWNGSRILDTANNVVGVNITSFSVFAPLGQMLNCNCSSCSECQDKLNNPGCDIVRLTTDISSNGTCIDDPADFSNKTFDCQGHTIIGNGTGIAIYIDSKEHNNITNCNITNFEYGIYLDKSTYNHLENITITSCSDKSIYLFHSPGNEFKNVYAEGNSSTGLYIRNVISGGLTWISAYTPGSDTDSENNTFYNLTLKHFDDYIIYNTNISNPNRFFNLTIKGNESGKLHWDSLSLTDANLSENNLIVQNDFISIKDTVSENQEFLTDATLTLNAGDCTNLHFYKLSGFPQTRSEIISSGTLFTPTAYSCSDGIVEFTTVLGTGYAVRSVPTAEEETAGLPVRRKRRGCFEKWNCTDWGPCINGTQTRICYDIGSCKRPPRTESRPCVVQPKPAPPKPELKIKKEKPLPPAKPCKPPIVVLILIAGMFAHLAYCSIKLRQAPTEKEKRDFFDYIFGDALAIVALIVLAYILCPTSLENIVILTIASLAAIASIIWAFRHEAYELFTKRLKAERRLITAPEKKLRKRLEKERMLAEIERKKLAKARKTIAKALKRKLVHEEETIKKPEAALRKQLLEKIVPPTPTEIAKHKLELKQRLTREERALLKPEKELLKKVEKEKLALEKERKKRVKEIEHELKEKLLAEAAAITEPEKRLHKLLALEKARRAKALKKALEERKKELERIKRREAYEKRKRMLEEKVKREAELRKKLEEKAREISHTLNKFILKAMEQGLNKPKIKTLLINAGWNAKFIEKYVDKFYKLNAGLILRLRRMRHEQIEKGIFQLIDEIKEELKHPSIEKHYPVKISKKKKKEIIKTKKAPKINRHKADEKSSILIEKINKLIDHIDEELEKLKKF